MNFTDDLKGANILIDYFKIPRVNPDLYLLRYLLQKFSFIPYENATKIIKNDFSVNSYNSFRLPFELASDYIKFGSGGTCFSLVYLFKTLLDQCGFTSTLLLADRTYGTDTHTAIIVNLSNKFYLVDPGYLIFDPLDLSLEHSTVSHTGINRIYIEPISGGKFFDVYTLENKGLEKFRYRLKNEKVERDIYFEAWKKSFEFEMMNYLVITRTIDDKHIYIRDNYFQSKSSEEKVKKLITSKELMEITRNIGISDEIIGKALKIVGKT